MRSSLAAAAGLLAVNLALLDRDEPAPPPPAFEPFELAHTEVTIAHDPPAVCAAVDLTELSGTTHRLATLWRERHPCDPLPDCGIPDPIATLDAELDAAPGLEHVVGDRRFGVAMFAAGGDLLAVMEPRGCAGWPPEVAGDQSLRLGTQSVTGSPYPQLVVTTRTVAHCGEALEATIVDRRAADLVTLATLDLEGDRGCSVWQSQITARIAVPRPGEIVVHYHGRMRHTDDAGEYLPWGAVDEHCTLRAGADGRFHPIDDASRERCYQPD